MAVNWNIIHPPMSSLSFVLTSGGNLMRSTARWIQDPETSLAFKIAMVALAILALFAAGAISAPADLIGFAVVSTTVWGGGLAIEKLVENLGLIKHLTVLNLFLPNRRQLPPPTLFPPLVIKTDGRLCVPPEVFENHHHFAMQGSDQYNRPFVVIRIGRDQNPTVGTLILHQRYINEPNWTYSYYFDDNDFHSFDLTSDAVGELLQLVDGEHPIYRIAPNV